MKNGGGGPLKGPGVPDEYGWVPISAWTEASLATLLREERAEVARLLPSEDRKFALAALLRRSG